MGAALAAAVMALPLMVRAMRLSLEAVDRRLEAAAATLALAPLVRAGLIQTTGVVINSITGVSGAGRALKHTSLFCTADEDVNAYGLLDHRHTPEIVQNLSGVAGTPVRVGFTPLLVPMSRGILATGHPDLPYVPGCEVVGRTVDGRVVWVFGGGFGRTRNGGIGELQMDRLVFVVTEVGEKDGRRAIEGGLAVGRVRGEAVAGRVGGQAIGSRRAFSCARLISPALPSMPVTDRRAHV